MFCLTEFENLFGSLSPQELGELLEKTETSAPEAELKKLRSLSFKKAGLKEPKKGKIISFKVLALAVCLCAVLLCTFWGVRNFSKPDTVSQPETTDRTVSAGENNPLMLAISKGDEGLIEKLLKSKTLVNRDVLNYAVNCTSFLSYTVINEIAKAVESAFGSTGLDPLLESTLIGNSQKALEELQKKDKMLMTPTERLAFFFSVAFCNSDVVKAFCEKGADISSTDAAGNSVLQIAQKYGNTQNADYARQQGINQ